MSQFICKVCGGQADPKELATHEGMCLGCYDFVTSGDDDE